MAQNEEGLAPTPKPGNGLVGELQVLALGWDWPARAQGACTAGGGFKEVTY